MQKTSTERVRRWRERHPELNRERQRVYMSRWRAAKRQKALLTLGERNA